MPVLDVNTRKIIHIDWPLHRVGKNGALSANSTCAPNLDEDSFKASGRDRIPPPMAPQNYLPELVAGNPGFKLPVTDPLKPLHVVQPEGVSFKMVNGRELEWQNWKMHIGTMLLVLRRFICLLGFVYRLWVASRTHPFDYHIQ